MRILNASFKVATCSSRVFRAIMLGRKDIFIGGGRKGKRAVRPGRYLVIRGRRVAIGSISICSCVS